ncbi:putative tetratricopeptide-like helical domain superfamily, 3-dehydroquinate synthase [Helianthus annuus]|nr:putative tetratricopeptide-like helical domain superfamily, 3-dehydroquinate synthase [Helianthus annuus]KAJ0662613.1 putative tetratricopeptide-like helical domain superfamily, 3-dehydroquinate synthase [Helianthus annuus]KAJ0670129.1 putative tetratricopeptide-like helical domain superfamily, 3-dehydroquinate synthase [Helianthus annuus]KAJ0847953.1 putative tetratricopeptide-like helical domain superfamily, 3-dehydroquinate synthase [Helianthus annuus]
MTEHNIGPYLVHHNRVLSAFKLGSCGIDEEALSVFNDMKHNEFSPDVVSYTSLINAFGKSHQLVQVMEVFTNMNKHKLRLIFITYNALINAFRANGFQPEVVYTLQKMETNEVRPNIVMIGTLLAWCGCYGPKVKIDLILAAATKWGICFPSVVYNSTTWSRMNQTKGEKALALYTSTKKQKVTPDSVTFTVLLTGCSKMSTYTKALAIIPNMVYLHITISKEGSSWVISVSSKLQDPVLEAESMFSTSKMTHGCPNTFAYVVNCSCETMVEVLLQDKKESVLQATLDLGPPLGHANENCYGYGPWFHLEVVVADPIMVADISYHLGWIDDSVVERYNSMDSSLLGRLSHFPEHRLCMVHIGYWESVYLLPFFSIPRPISATVKTKLSQLLVPTILSIAHLVQSKPLIAALYGHKPLEIAYCTYDYSITSLFDAQPWERTNMFTCRNNSFARVHACMLAKHVTTWEAHTSLIQFFTPLHLEDKVNLKGGSNVMKRTCRPILASLVKKPNKLNGSMAHGSGERTLAGYKRDRSSV